MGPKGSVDSEGARLRRRLGPAIAGRLCKRVVKKFLSFDSGLWPLRVVVSSLEPLRGSGSEGSEGSEGSKGDGIAFGDDFKDSVTGLASHPACHSEPQAENFGCRRYCPRPVHQPTKEARPAGSRKTAAGSRQPTAGPLTVPLSHYPTVPLSHSSSPFSPLPI